jgi:hypothetical protein
VRISVLSKSGDWPHTMERCRGKCSDCDAPIHPHDPCAVDVASVDGVWPRAYCASCWSSGRVSEEMEAYHACQ